MSRTRVSIRCEPVGPSSSISSAGRSSGLQDPGPQRVVDVVVDVGDAVDQLDDLALQRRRLARAGVVEDAVAHLLGQVEAVALALEHVDDPQRVLVVRKPPSQPSLQRRVERLLAGVAEGRMAEVVAEPDRLGQVLVQAAARGRRCGRSRRPRACGSAGSGSGRPRGRRRPGSCASAAGTTSSGRSGRGRAGTGCAEGCPPPRPRRRPDRTESPGRRGTRPPRR